MWSNFRISIFIYYFITVVGFLGFGYYFLIVLEFENLYLLSLFLLSFVVVSAVFISKLAVDPLFEYVTNLQRLSRETLHELNLPISTIITNSQMLSKTLDDEKSLKRVGRITTACDMLKERYNELDYMIKMQTKEDIREKFLVDELVKSRVEFLQRIYPHMKFSTSLEHLEQYGDKKGLTKVIDNIIDNGVKYSQNSKNIDIKIENNILLIQDHGIGMDEVELMRIFDNYYQSDSNMQGFGIGLNMVKRFCDKNGIKLSFKSAPNVGTSVELKFL
ncbi:sensor histidine kinase [Sulfurimonas aquatica]|uniref:histidine kinase n=1 Tax=Sulfurimonas aquatica TaxID=2672570 RepID=A0A975GCE7_9BACT|nr:HAMP domain-containing sensor histidine kinase [Sulfurimonas aquatica]QSZ41199.1 sensor histidine kinase [Sulfurimonas aquatica]